MGENRAAFKARAIRVWRIIIIAYRRNLTACKRGRNGDGD